MNNLDSIDKYKFEYVDIWMKKHSHITLSLFLMTYDLQFMWSSDRQETKYISKLRGEAMDFRGSKRLCFQIEVLVRMQK